jgi:hypothetical protein
MKKKKDKAIILYVLACIAWVLLIMAVTVTNASCSMPTELIQYDNYQLEKCGRGEQ